MRIIASTRRTAIGIGTGLFMAAAILGAAAQESAPIVVEMAQEGFAGRTGTRLVIAGDGSFRELRFVNETETPTGRSGRLAQGDMDRLRQTLAEKRIADLPETLGSPSQVNNAMVTLRVGPISRRSFEPAGSLQEPDFAANAAQRGSADQRRLYEAVGAALQAVGPR